MNFRTLHKDPSLFNEEESIRSFQHLKQFINPAADAAPGSASNDNTAVSAKRRRVRKDTEVATNDGPVNVDAAAGNIVADCANYNSSTANPTARHSSNKSHSKQPAPTAKRTIMAGSIPVTGKTVCPRRPALTTAIAGNIAAHSLWTAATMEKAKTAAANTAIFQLLLRVLRSLQL